MPEDGNRWRAKRIDTLLPQAMRAIDLDCWFVLTREHAVDPVARDVGLEHAVLAAAGVFLDRGERVERIAVVANFDTAPVDASGIYDRIIAYGAEGALPHIGEVLLEANPKKIAVNTSEVSPVADGLTVGMRGYLERAIGPDLASRIVSAEEMVAGFRSRRLEGEIDVYQEAIETTELIIRDALSPEVVTPGETTERDVADWMRARLWEMDLDPAWDIEGCPNVWTHPRGHGGPSDAVIQGGDTLSVDFGIRLIGYCTDLQRTAYVLRPGEAEIPEDISRMWETVVASNRAAVEAMRPGVTGCDVDAAARAVVVEAGYEAYPHATGHVVGFLAHEIGPLLGPDWPDRYGKTVHRTLDAGQIYAVEPAVSFSRHGVVFGTGLEEDVLVTETGAVYLSRLQEDLILLG